MRLSPEIERLVKLQRVELETVKCADNIGWAYGEMMNCEMEDILNAMTLIKAKTVPNPFRVLDIGCGVGGLDVLIHRCIKDRLKSVPELHLVDKDGEKVVYGYHETKDTGYYNDLAITRKFLKANGVPSGDFKTYDISKGELPDRSIKFDMIISMKSCGFHYPVSAYKDIFLKQLSKTGVILVDCRNGSNASMLDKVYTRVLMSKHPKHERRAYIK